MKSYRELVIDIFNSKECVDNIKNAFKYINKTQFYSISDQERKILIDKLKLAFHRKKSIKNIFIFGKDEKGRYLASVESYFFSTNNAVIADIEIDIEDDKMIRISLVDLATGEIVQGTYNK